MKNGLAARTFLPTYRDELFAPIEQQFDKFFRDFFQPSTINGVKASNGYYPKIDVVEDKDNFIIRAAVPGVELENLSVEFTPAVASFCRSTDSATTNSSIGSRVPANVRISGQMSDEYTNPSGSDFYYRELHKSRFSRVIELPNYLTDEEPETSLKDGVLTLKWKNKSVVQIENHSKKLKINTE